MLRDYSGQVTALQTSNGQKHAVKVNRMGNLETFETPEGYHAEFRYVGSTGLLESKLDSQNYGYVFKYDQYGRLGQAVAPTGETTFLTFNLTAQGGNIAVEGSGARAVLSVNDNKVVVTEAGAGEGLVTTIQPDKTLVVNRGGDRTLTLATITHPVISHSQPVIGDSYPMVGQLRVETGGNNLVSKIDWEYALQTSGHDHQLLDVSKRLQVNGENLLVVNYDKLQRREILSLPDKTELLQIKYDEHSRPVTWVSAGPWAPASQRYDRFGHLVAWQWGQLQEKYTYDKNGRMASVVCGNATQLTYEYKERDMIPFKVRTGNGATFLLDYDPKSGAVRSVTTPRGHIHSWTVQPDIGALRWNYIAPWSTAPLAVVFNTAGRPQMVQLPSGNERVTYLYTPTGRLQSVLAGQTEVELTRSEADSALVDSIYISQGWKFMSCSHCQELGQQASWLLIGCSRH